MLSIVFVISVLLFTFKSAGAGARSFWSFRGSIWINFSIPYLAGNNLFFLTYLIISAIQMGANIDYAIVISSRFMECASQLPLKKAIVESMNLAFPTIVTSGTMLASAGLIIGLVTSDGRSPPSACTSAWAPRYPSCSCCSSCRRYSCWATF